MSGIFVTIVVDSSIHFLNLMAAIATAQNCIRELKHSISFAASQSTALSYACKMFQRNSIFKVEIVFLLFPTIGSLHGGK